MGTPYAKMTPEQKASAHASNKKWSINNKEKKAAYRHKHYMENREKFLHIERERAYQKRYGISVADYDAMLVAQGGCCKICGRHRSSLNKKFKFFSVDHDHKTGKVRGILCQKCNSMLDWYLDHADGFQSYTAVKQ